MICRGIMVHGDSYADAKRSLKLKARTLRTTSTARTGSRGARGGTTGAGTGSSAFSTEVL